MMPVKPEGSLLTFSNTSPSLTATVAIKSVEYETTTLPFSRVEFSGDKLRAAKNVDGSLPVFTYLSGNRIIQYFTNCNLNETTRPLTPDDTRVDSMYQRFDILRFTITGDANSSSQTDILASIARTHQIYLAEFDAHQRIAQGDVSYSFLLNLQTETFSYLTATGLTLTGRSLGSFSGQSNLLITKFLVEGEFEVPNSDGSTSTVLNGFQMTIENRAIQAARSSSF